MKYFKQVVILALVCIFMTACASTRQAEVNSEPQIIYKDIYEYSTEGGFIKAVVIDEEIQHIYVKLYGETGQYSEEYSFGNNIVTIFCVRENYNQPFYMDPDNISISSVEYSQYLLINNVLYDYTAGNDELHEVDEATSDRVLQGMDNFIQEIEYMR